MESCANDTTLDHDTFTTYTAAEPEAISQLTAELFCTDTLKELYVAAVRDEDIGANKLYEQLRHDFRSLGLFVKSEDRALWKFAEALQDGMISDGIARAVVSYAQEVVRREGAVDEKPCAADLASTGETVEAAPATIAGRRPRPHPARPTFHLDPPTAHAILDLGAYITLTPALIHRILHSKRYLTLQSQLLNLVFDTYAQRLLTAIGPTAIGEDGHPLRRSRLQTTIDELARTPPHKVSYAAHGTKASQVVWTWKAFVDGEEKEVKVEAPVLREGFARVMWSSKEGFVRFVDVGREVFGGLMEAVRGAPGVRGWVVC